MDIEERVDAIDRAWQRNPLNPGGRPLTDAGRCLVAAKLTLADALPTVKWDRNPVNFPTPLTR